MNVQVRNLNDKNIEIQNKFKLKLIRKLKQQTSQTRKMKLISPMYDL